MELARKAAKTNLIGLSISFFFAVCVGLVFEVAPETPAIAARTSIGSSDLILALAAGSAGTLAFNRTTGAPAALIGVMVACGTHAPAGYVRDALGRGKMAVVFWCVFIGGSQCHLRQYRRGCHLCASGVRPRTWWEAKKARKATIKAGLILFILFVLLILILLLTNYKIV